MCTNNAIGVISLAKPVKKGFLKRYKKSFLWSKWRQVWIVLHEDSSLEWYKNETEEDFEGGLTLKEAPEMIAAGPFANYVPGKPDLPKGTDPNCLMVFSNKEKNKIAWFLSSNTDDLAQWMTAISNTLPPPPPVPQDQSQQPNQNPTQPDKQSDMPPPYNPAPSAPPDPGIQNNVVQGNRPHMVNGGGQSNYRGPFQNREPYMGRDDPRMAGGGYGRGGGGPSTVIIERGSDGLGNFASGMMMGSALTGWGSGFGWGLGPRFGGWGFGMGFGIGPPIGVGYGSTAVNITNNVTNTNEVNTNNIDTENPSDADPLANPEQAAPAEEGSVDPGLASGVDSNGFEPGFEPDAEMIPNSGIDPGLLDDGGFDMERMEMHNAGPGEFDMGGGGYDMGGGGYDMGGGGYDMGGGYGMGGGGFDMGEGGFDFGGGGGFDMGGGGFDMGGMDFGF